MNKKKISDINPGGFTSFKLKSHGITIVSSDSKDIHHGKKPPLSLVPGTFATHVAMALEDGAKKRRRYNYRDGKVSAMDLLDKILRHTYLIIDRHDYADDSHLHELAHAAANIAVYLDAMEQGTLDDDRPIAGKTNDVMNRFSNE